MPFASWSWAAIPWSLSADTRAVAAAVNCGGCPGKTATITLVAETSPTVGLPARVRTTSPPSQLISFHCALANACSIASNKWANSASPGGSPPSNFVFWNDCSRSAMASCWSGFRTRGALNFSNASWASSARVVASATAFCNAKFSEVWSVCSWPLLRQWRNPATDFPTTPMATNTPKTINQMSSVLNDHSSSARPTASSSPDDDSFFDYFAAIIIVAGFGALISPVLALRRVLTRRRRNVTITR